MTDTRCADPELQLDVDIMIQEYTLYKAIQAQFDFLSSRTEAKAIEATRVLSIFDSFIRIFNQTHPSHKNSLDFYTNLDILEFLVVLSSRSATTTPFSADTPAKLRIQTARNLDSRRRWLVAREQHLRRHPTSTEPTNQQNVESQTYHAWRGRHSISSTQAATPQPALFDLLTRFMTISAEFSALTGQDPSDEWMEIACKFMLQASVEALQHRLDLLDPHTDTDIDMDGGVDTDTQPRLEDCFAWGYVDEDLLPNEEAVLNILFCDPETGNTENPSWTSLRNRYLLEFSIAFDAAAQSQTCRLDRLAKKCAFTNDQEGLVSFMANVWGVYCEQLGGGKPVLVQIEEGHIKSFGIEGREFDEFMVRVGLKKDVRGVWMFDFGSGPEEQLSATRDKDDGKTPVTKDDVSTRISMNDGKDNVRTRVRSNI